MKTVLVLKAVSETATGAALQIVPSVVGQWLLGAELTCIDEPVARGTGIALIAFEFACWPGTPLLGMLTYTALVTVHLANLGIRREWFGPLLWRADALHAVFTVLLARTCVGLRHAAPHTVGADTQ